MSQQPLDAQPQQRFCVNCQNFRPGFFSNEYAKCYAPSIIDPVMGYMQENYADLMRRSDCGPGGNLFVPKAPTFWQNLRPYIRARWGF